MLCKDLKEGMLIRISDEKFCAWLNLDTHSKLLEEWPEIPPRIRVGSRVIASTFSNTFYEKNDPIVYVGKKLLVSKDGCHKRQIRLVLAGGQVGFVEGYDIKNFEPYKESE